MRKVKNMYDSTNDTKSHIKHIQDIFTTIVIPELSRRALNHDASKFDSPEKETYDKYIPLLQKVKYGTDEYNALKEEMSKTGTGHHYSVNRHHPEHFEHGIKEMTLFDLIEMYFDWFAASLRSDTGFGKVLEMNIEKYDISNDLAQIFINTYNEYLKDKVTDLKNK